jgi:hypothetical protein
MFRRLGRPQQGFEQGEHSGNQCLVTKCTGDAARRALDFPRTGAAIGALWWRLYLVANAADAAIGAPISARAQPIESVAAGPGLPRRHDRP